MQAENTGAVSDGQVQVRWSKSLLQECNACNARWIFPIQTAWNGGLGEQMWLVHGPTSSSDLQLFSLCGHVLGAPSARCVYMSKDGVCCCALGHICCVSSVCVCLCACAGWRVSAMRDQSDILPLPLQPGSYLSCPAGLKPDDTHSSGVCLHSLTHSVCACVCVCF